MQMNANFTAEEKQDEVQMCLYICMHNTFVYYTMMLSWDT